MFWTPCAAYCISLMLKDIEKLSIVKMILTRAMEVTCYIYSHSRVLNLIRKQMGKRELLRRAFTLFACHIILDIVEFALAKSEVV